MTKRTRSPLRRWDDLTVAQRRALIAGGVGTTLWQLAMLRDLSRRPPDEIRGSKRGWVAASFVRPFGQLAYYFWGRRQRRDGRAPSTDATP